MTRIATMWQAANQRANNSSLPAGSRTSYRSAVASLRQALIAGHLRPSGSSSGTANLPVSSFQLTDDIQTLRSTASSMGGAGAANLNQVAMFYATGAKEFFTGTIRDALLSTNSTRGMAMTSGSTGTASSSIMPARGGLNAYRAEGHRPVGGILQTDGTLTSTPPDAYIAPTQLPAVGDSADGTSPLPIIGDPFPFDTGDQDSEVVYPGGTNVYPAGTTLPITNQEPPVPVAPTNIPAAPNHVP